MVSIPDFPQKGKKNRFFTRGRRGRGRTHPTRCPCPGGLGRAGPAPGLPPCLGPPCLGRLYSECFWSGAACLGTLAAGCPCSESPAVSGPRPGTLAVGRRALWGLPLFEADGCGAPAVRRRTPSLRLLPPPLPHRLHPQDHLLLGGEEGVVQGLGVLLQKGKPPKKPLPLPLGEALGVGPRPGVVLAPEEPEEVEEGLGRGIAGKGLRLEVLHALHPSPRPPGTPPGRPAPAPPRRSPSPWP